MSSERQAVRNWEAFKLMLEDPQTTDQSRSMANILFEPNKNLEVLISELTETDGRRDFERFIHLHRTIVDYFTEIDDYIGTPPRFKTDGVIRLKDYNIVQIGYEHHERNLQELSGRIIKLETAQKFLEKVLPYLHHVLFDDTNCPADVYNIGRIFLQETSTRSTAHQEANDLIPRIIGDTEGFLEKVSKDVIKPSPRSEYSEDSMKEGVSYYLRLTFGAVLVDNELVETNRRYNKVVSKDMVALKSDKREELFKFIQDMHPIYNTGRYGGYAHVVTPKILVKIAKEFSDAGGNISFNINL